MQMKNMAVQFALIFFNMLLANFENLKISDKKAFVCKISPITEVSNHFHPDALKHFNSNSFARNKKLLFSNSSFIDYFFKK